MIARKVSEKKAGGAPSYIVTYSDMITLLLTFFVMLIGMAKDQQDALFEVGQNSFKQAVSDFGLSGSFIRRSSGPQFQHMKRKYHADEGQDESESRSVDAQTEMLRRTILTLEEMMKITPPRITGKSKTFTVADVHFENSSWKLDRSATQFLDKYSRQISESFSGETVTVYVVGLAENEPSEKEKWSVSAHRADRVASYIRENLPDQTTWKVYSWGAGPGGEWAGANGVVGKKTDILIVALTE